MYITEFRGRGEEIHIYPLTFKEFMQAYDGDMYHGWAEYVIYGGLPLCVTMKTEEQKIGYLTRLFEETYLKDIIERHHIEKTQELEDLINILASARGFTDKSDQDRSNVSKCYAVKNQLEIDFVANMGSKRYYIQSAFNMPTEEKRNQEKASLLNVNDSFKKIIVVKDVVNVMRDYTFYNVKM